MGHGRCSSRWWVGILVVLVGLLVVQTPPSAAQRASLSGIDAKLDEVLRKLDEGAPGAGLSAFEEVQVEGTPPADAAGRRSMSATCPAGKMAVGGSYSIFANGGNYGWGIVAVSTGTFSSTFNPADPPDAFFVLTADAPGYANVPFFRVIVKCAKAS
jgi:hypothetical protein